MTDITDTAPDFDLADLESSDEAVLAIRDRNGRPTTWLWTFYGPGHPASIAVADRVSRKWMDEARQKEQAQVNGKKWKAPEQSINDVIAENVTNIVDRLKSFTPVKLNGQVIEYSKEEARKMLLDPRKGALLDQVSEFLKERESFMRPSAKS